MDRADEYLLRAAGADESAKSIADPDMKRQFAKIADQWRGLARQARALGGNSILRLD